MKELKSLTITPGILCHSSKTGSKYIVPVEENNQINFKEKKYDKIIMPEPLEKILIGKSVYTGEVKIDIIDATTVPNYEQYFEIFRQKQESKDLFSKYKNRSFFP